MSMAIPLAGDHQLQQMTKTSSMCAMLFEETNEKVFTKYAKVGILVGGAHSILHKDFNMHCLCQHLV
jgi:hypothetical protein